MRNIITAAVSVEKQQCILIAIEIPADNAFFHTVIQCRDPQRLHSAAGKSHNAQILGIPFAPFIDIIDQPGCIPGAHARHGLAQRLCHMCQMEAGAVQERFLIRSLLQCLIPALSETSAIRADCHIAALRQLHAVIVMVELDHPLHRGDIVTPCHTVFTGSLMSRKGKKTFLFSFSLLGRDQDIHRHIHFRLYLNDNFLPADTVLQLHDFFHAGLQITGLHVFPSQKVF